jgi:hypothetical protein
MAAVVFRGVVGAKPTLGSFPHHGEARILAQPRPLHWRRLARVVRCEVRGGHLEGLPALLEARIRAHGVNPACV